MWTWLSHFLKIIVAITIFLLMNFPHLYLTWILVLHGTNSAIFSLDSVLKFSVFHFSSLVFTWATWTFELIQFELFRVLLYVALQFVFFIANEFWISQHRYLLYQDFLSIKFFHFMKRKSTFIFISWDFKIAFTLISGDTVTFVLIIKYNF